MHVCVCVCVCAMRVFTSVHMYSYKMHVDRNYAKKIGGEHVHVYNEQHILKPQYTPFPLVMTACMECTFSFIHLSTCTLNTHHTEAISSPSRKVMCAQAPGWTGRSSQLCLPPVSRRGAVY